MTTRPKIEGSVQITIRPLNFKRLQLKIVGTAPYVMARFSAKSMQAMMAKMEAGSTAKGKKVREPRDFDEDVKNAMHVSTEGWPGIPASSIRNACISACRLVNFKMTLAKLSVFVEADGLDAVDGIPLIRIEGVHEKVVMHVRNQTGVTDIRTRPMWREWSAILRLKYDADQFTSVDIVNLLNRAGQQVGLGEGRPDSRSSAGLGWGTFEIVNQGDQDEQV